MLGDPEAKISVFLFASLGSDRSIDGLTLSAESWSILGRSSNYIPNFYWEVPVRSLDALANAKLGGTRSRGCYTPIYYLPDCLTHPAQFREHVIRSLLLSIFV
jgi:hypothetical protein